MKRGSINHSADAVVAIMEILQHSAQPHGLYLPRHRQDQGPAKCKRITPPQSSPPG